MGTTPGALRAWDLTDDLPATWAPATHPHHRGRLLHVGLESTGMPDLNSEGFVMAPQAECVGGLTPAF